MNNLLSLLLFTGLISCSCNKEQSIKQPIQKAASNSPTVKRKGLEDVSRLIVSFQGNIGKAVLSIKQTQLQSFEFVGSNTPLALKTEEGIKFLTTKMGRVLSFQNNPCSFRVKNQQKMKSMQIINYDIKCSKPITDNIFSVSLGRYFKQLNILEFKIQTKDVHFAENIIKGQGSFPFKARQTNAK